MIFGSPLRVAQLPPCAAVFGWLWRRHGRRPRTAVRLELFTRLSMTRFPVPGEEIFPMFLLQDDQQVSVAVQAVDKMGEPAALAAGLTAVWSSSDATIASVNADATNSLSAVVASVGAAGAVKLGTAQISVVVTDPSAPAGTAPLTASFEVQVVAGAAAGIQIQPGTPSSRLPAGA